MYSTACKPLGPDVFGKRVPLFGSTSYEAGPRRRPRPRTNAASTADAASVICPLVAFPPPSSPSPPSPLAPSCLFALVMCRAVTASMHPPHA